MARAGGDSSSWPAAFRTAAHPQHELVHLHFYRNSCDLCGGALAGKLGYRCEACDFDIHCGCLPETRTLARGAAAHHPTPPPARPDTSWHGAGTPDHHHHHAPLRRPQVNLSLSSSCHFQTPYHQDNSSPAAQTSAVSNYPAPQAQYNYGYERGAESNTPASYNHMQQQDDYQATNNYEGYAGDEDIEQLSDYENDMDD